MTRFAGVVGYEVGQIESAPGVWVANIVERNLRGDVKRGTRQARDGEHLNSDLTVQHLVEVVADEYARENYAVIKYVKMNGVRWVVDSVEARHPRFILRLGRRYDGPTPPTAP